MLMQSIRNRSGITLMEVLVVMVLIGIFAVIVATRNMGIDPSLIAQTEVLESHIRYAQMRSLNTNSQWGIHCQGGTYAIWIYQNPNTTNPQYLPGQLPGQDPYRVANQVQLGTLGIGISPAAFDLAFGSWGEPIPYNGLAFVNNSLTLTLTKAGQTQSIFITQLTGFIP